MTKLDPSVISKGEPQEGQAGQDNFGTRAIAF